MSQPTALLISYAAGGYLAAGLAFAGVFAARWAGHLDPAAANGTWGFRLLLLPGATLLWPYLVVRLLLSGIR